MTRPSYLEDYNFNWESMDIIVSGTSSIDTHHFMPHITDHVQAKAFLRGYGFDMDDPVEAGELFGNFQESIQFIKRYFLKEGNPDEGLDLVIPNLFYSIMDLSELILISTGHAVPRASKEESLWAGIILKVMHTILHTDKDLRSRYFSSIQTQIFDRFYKYLERDEDDHLFLKNENDDLKIPLVSFETKSKKTRESTIIKLLHKKENVAEELFDRVGVRFVTETKIDVLRVITFLNQHHIIMANNTKPSRAQNTLLDLDHLHKSMLSLYKVAMKENWERAKFEDEVEKAALSSALGVNAQTDNKHTNEAYKAVHFTCRQLIQYENPFYQNFTALKKMAKEMDRENPLVKSVLATKTDALAKEVRFFYPYEVQITDRLSHEQNTQGDASHKEYKRSQLISAMDRLFAPLQALNKN